MQILPDELPIFRENAPSASCQIIGIGTANSEHSYTQHELLERFEIQDRRVRSAFLNGGIHTRYLTLPEKVDGRELVETQQQLLNKHRTQGVAMACKAIQNCLDKIGATAKDIRFLCCVTTTGFLTPSLSALLLRELELPHCTRLDVVGMGCNAGLNGLNATSNWSLAHPDELALMVCVEVCSAAYVFDESIETAVVNSLFGDGAATVALLCSKQRHDSSPSLLKFSSCLVPEAIDAMRFDWDDQHGKFNFRLDRDVPYVVGSHIEHAVDLLLSGSDVSRSDVAHWVIHSGGKKVIDSVRINLGLSRHDVRHTLGVLRDYGNLSSGSFLFSLQRLMNEQSIGSNDYGILITMGPGTTIETALVQWN